MGRQGGLCPDCWREAEFITGPACAGCGAPVFGGEGEGGAGDGRAGNGGDGAGTSCDECVAMPRPWQGARAALVYRGTGRRLVLMLKHGDRADLAVVLGRWMADAAAPLILPGMAVVPVPVHPRRLMRRKYNQAALLAHQIARRHRLGMLPAALHRLRDTPMQDHRSLADRWQNQAQALAVTPRMAARLRGRAVLLVDDVMASGATLTAAAGALAAAGAGPIRVALLARAVKDA